MKYIFVTGAPGSKWSSVVKNIYYSPDVDRSDYRDEWTYYHDASGKMELMHLGAYFDPGMESEIPEDLTEFRQDELEAFFSRPFKTPDSGVRIIKSHVFANNIDYIKRQWPDCPIVLVHRGDDACLGWWVKCGHFDITYPLYHKYYQDLKTMAKIIAQQNAGIALAQELYQANLVTAHSNYELCSILDIELPPPEYRQFYQSQDITVKVIL